MGAQPLTAAGCCQTAASQTTHGQGLLYSGGELSGLVSKHLNKWQKPSIQEHTAEGIMFSNPRDSCREMSWQPIRESAELPTEVKEALAMCGLKHGQHILYAGKELSRLA